MSHKKSRIREKRVVIWRSRKFDGMLTESFPEKVKFQQNNKKSEGINHEAEDTSIFTKILVKIQNIHSI